MHCSAHGNKRAGIDPMPPSPQKLRPEIKRIIEALATDIVAREDMEAASLIQDCGYAQRSDA